MNEEAITAARAAYDADDGTNWHDLDHEAAAAALGMDWREFALFVSQCDSRILAKPALATPGAVFRLRRWIALGKPDADPERIAYKGYDDTRAVIVDVLRRLPAPVRHYAVESVTWREADGLYITNVPRHLALPGDGGHEITIEGGVSPRSLPGQIAHEIGHGLHRVVYDGECDWSATCRVRLVDQIREGLATRDKWVGEQVAYEVIADQMAALWGIPRQDAPTEGEYRTHFEREFNRAAAIAFKSSEMREEEAQDEDEDEEAQDDDVACAIAAALIRADDEIEDAEDEIDTDDVPDDDADDIDTAAAEEAADSAEDADAIATFEPAEQDIDYQRGREAALESIRAVSRALRAPTAEALEQALTQHDMRGLALTQPSQFAAGWATVEADHRNNLDRVRAFLRGEDEASDVMLAKLLEHALRSR